MKKKILIIFVLYLIMSIFLYPLRESIWYNLFYTIAYMIAVMIYFSLIKKKPKFQVEVSHPKEIHLATCSPSIF
ncbi:TPA: hypothetical protein VU893_000395 [Streptococcus pneumoniae]|nr:immunity protein [Streptococcus pneumoniae]CXG12877.1 immunity protein [Streptococcus pneumoniae]CYH03008.1 immunity protein [Streptococcus pneumoniae]VJU17155.1 immunity protein [Streptococcus pneumoniae]VKQ53612.1 immunity protein [Streptococcus pneumoniae]